MNDEAEWKARDAFDKAIWIDIMAMREWDRYNERVYSRRGIELEEKDSDEFV